ncbi:MAG: DUF2868 domain-containing protein [Myxococcota bacterium]
MRLADLIDFEARVALDEELDPEHVRSRDRHVYLKLKPPPSPKDLRRPSKRRDLLRAWLEALRSEDHLSYGRRATVALRILGYGLAVLGFGSGWGLASALLAYRQGGPPVNVGTFVLTLIVAQAVLSVLFLLAVPLIRAFPRLPLLSDGIALLRWLSGRIQRWLSPLEERLSEEAQIVRSRLRTRASLHAPVEFWLLVGRSQIFAVFLNLGVLACCLRLILFSDLAFGWSTTGRALDEAWVHRITHTISIPWAEMVPAAVPCRELISATQYSRLEGRFQEAPPGQRGDLDWVGGWWPFLLAGVITYGLLPRLVFLGMALAFTRRALRRFPTDIPSVEQLIRRMTVPRVRLSAGDDDEDGATPSSSVLSRMEAASDDQHDGPAELCTLIAYRHDVPPRAERAVKKTFGFEVEIKIRLLGIHRDRERDAVEALAGGSGSVVVLVESWEPPDKAIRRFLSEIRQIVGARRPIWVAPYSRLDADGFEPAAHQDLQVWQDRLTLLEDPYLAVERLRAP